MCDSIIHSSFLNRPPSPNMTTTSLPDLPAETLLDISGYLSYGSHVALRLTCRMLFAKVEDPSSGPQGKAYNMADLLEIEQWLEYNAAKYVSFASKQAMAQRDFFACSHCLKICSAGKFSNAMMKGKRGKLGTGTVFERSRRFCIPCGMAHGRYQRGTKFQFGGAFGSYGFVCRGCGEFEQMSFCSEIQAARTTCADCWKDGERKYDPLDPSDILIDY